MTAPTAERGADLTYGYFGHIAKFDKLDDGTLMVYGKAVGPEVDLDEQICDSDWLKSAMPKWYEWGNVREQHNNIAAGVGIELTEGDDGGYWLKTHVVDPGTIKKVETRVLKGYSVGISNGRVVRDKAARGGRINDGTIHEISLVDRPANAACSISIAKSVDGIKFSPVEVGDIDEDGAEVVAVIDVPELDVLVPFDENSRGHVENQSQESIPAVEKSATWYRESLRLVEDALAGQFSSTVPFITKAAKTGSEDEHADVTAAYAAMDRILDLIIAEAGQAKGGRIKELRDIEVLIQACRALCCFIECEQDEDDEDELGDHDVSGYDLDDDKAYMIKSVSAAARRTAKREGDTMPDGSYPITNQDQLESALHLAGHSKTYSRARVMAHIRAQARKHGLSLPTRSTAGDKAAGSVTVDDAITEMITKAVATAQAESSAAHEAELATLRDRLEKALAVPAHGGPVTFKHVNKTSSAAPSQAPTRADPAYWTALADDPKLDRAIAESYRAKAASLTKGAST